MQNYIALLRGINVSGQKKIKMAELREQLSSLGFTDLQTYIQSGNIVFKTKKTSHSKLEKAIHNKIKTAYGFDVPVMVRTKQELAKAIQNCPYANDPKREEKFIAVTFLSAAPSDTAIAVLNEKDYSPEEWVIDNNILYLYAANGFGRAKMSNNLFERKLKLTATTRNWRTVNKLLEMSSS
ncbi:MAG TPA: DUF1697 domain-containing protein [Saprospiraceae bacterium]|nr:DUF1697 domain-containing protein [Saprospiraceae bacterium]